MTTFREVRRLPDFERDLKKLLKRFRSLEEDLSNFIDTELKLFHKQNTNTGWIVRLQNLGFEEPRVYKARRFACKSLKGKGSHSGIRVIYTYFEEDDRIELIEIYFKGNKENEDKTRIANKV